VKARFAAIASIAFLGAFFCAAAIAEAGRILLIQGSSNETTPAGGIAIGDRFVRDRLQTGLGHTVQMVPDSASQDSLVRSAGRCDLVVVLESVTSTKLLAKLKGIPQPLLNFEAFIQDDLGMTALGPSGDPGPPSRFEFGVMEKSDRIAIRDPSHPLAAGFTGQVQVYSQLKQITWGKVAPTAEVIATLITDTSGAAIYVYRKGSVLFDKSLAAGLRIGYFLEDDNVTGTPNLMTTQGLALFDRAVAFGLSGGTVAIRPVGARSRILTENEKAFIPFHAGTPTVWLYGKDPLNAMDAMGGSINGPVTRMLRRMDGRIQP
jgi:hypothetical protein